MDLLPMVNLASNLERQILGKPTGTQDYFPPLYSGLNIIEYGPGKPKVTTLVPPENAFSEKLLVVYSGKSHHSGINNWEVFKKASEGDPQTLGALGKIHDIGRRMESLVLNGGWEKVPLLFDEEFLARKELSPEYVSPEIEKLRKVALQVGARSIKICGAGGGGCVVAWCDLPVKALVSKSLKSAGFEVLKAKVFAGTH